MDHLGFTVPNLAEAIEFFLGLGVELLYEEGPYRDTGDALRRQVDVDPGAEYRLAMLRFGSTTTLELLEYQTREATAQPPRNSDHSAAHLGLRVADIDQAIAWLRERADVQVLDGRSPSTMGHRPACAGSMCVLRGGFSWSWSSCQPSCST
jgi:catechol 2,3-dioxygenase-like lactoylglutathione lyase family enzyme